MLMNVINKCRRDLHRLNSALRIEPAVASTKTEHLRDAVPVVQFEKERANDVVQARTQTATRNDPGARLLRIEKKLRARSGQLELDPWIRADLDALGNANVIAGRVTFRGGEACFAECGRIHRKRKIASTCAERMRKSVVSG